MADTTKLMPQGWTSRTLIRILKLSACTASSRFAWQAFMLFLPDSLQVAQRAQRRSYFGAAANSKSGGVLLIGSGAFSSGAMFVRLTQPA